MPGILCQGSSDMLEDLIPGILCQEEVSPSPPALPNRKSSTTHTEQCLADSSSPKALPPDRYHEMQCPPFAIQLQRTTAEKLHPQPVVVCWSYNNTHFKPSWHRAVNNDRDASAHPECGHLPVHLHIQSHQVPPSRADSSSISM